MTPRPIVLSGPSGAGKSTLLKKLFAEYPGRFGFSVSHTTRKSREGEEHGTHYHYVSRSHFEDLIKNNKFLEYAEFGGNLYGTTTDAVRDVAKTGCTCVLDIDMQGVKSVKKTDLNPVYIFVGPPSSEALRERLVRRGSETPESLEKRLEHSVREIEYSKTPGAYDLVLINDDLEKTYAEFRRFINDVEHYH